VKLRCWPGCIAFVVNDTNACRMNIGRLVAVRGPVQINRDLELPCWLVRPLSRAPYAIEHQVELTIGRVSWKSRAEHPDAWLTPIRWAPGVLLTAATESLAGAQGASATGAELENSVQRLTRRFRGRAAPESCHKGASA
jgi:hypothetical protein